jgi:uncharacterized protein (DUF1501 family)
MSDPFACNEYNAVSRRKFLGGTAAAIAASSLPAFLPKVAFAQGTSTKDVLIFIQLIGGVDALTVCVPHGDPIYYSSRPTLAIPQPGSGSQFAAIDLDGYFGLPQCLNPLKPIFDNGHLGIIHAAGRDNWTRSHFDAQFMMQSDSINLTDGGWIARHLASSSQTYADAEFRGFAFTDTTPVTMVKGQQVVSTSRPESIAFGAGYADDAEIAATISRMYSRVKDESRGVVRDSKRTIDALSPLNLGSYSSAASLPYPDTLIGNALRSSAGMIKGGIGVEVLQIDWPGWDTHAGQGSVGGLLHNMLRTLADGLAAFYADMEASGRTDWTIVLLSEFGRQVEENGSQGTEHGSGGTLLTLGPNVQSGIHTTWPGLEIENRRDGVDIMPTTDYRDVLGELLRNRLHNGNVSYVLPSKPVENTGAKWFKAA